MDDVGKRPSRSKKSLPFICINCYAASGYSTQGDHAKARSLHNSCINSDLTQIACNCAHAIVSA